jgi:hypothetical protein
MATYGRGDVFWVWFWFRVWSGSGSGSGHIKTRSRPIMSREGLNQSPYDPFSSQSRPRSLGHGHAPVGGEQRLPRTVSTPDMSPCLRSRSHPSLIRQSPSTQVHNSLLRHRELLTTCRPQYLGCQENSREMHHAAVQGVLKEGNHHPAASDMCRLIDFNNVSHHLWRHS